MTVDINQRLVVIETDKGTGSGILVNSNGLILSCYHNFSSQKGDEYLLRKVELRALMH